ncbi:class I SAM-dependent DNA methyltransferase [Goodfellowiella coeruleoviolacea]|uniref:Methyltransferase domain-containing protein n=1 Tax=Goodfellowiella coeruleoviolacea TaxID=334858 RepID=A0AAE3GGI2_9PSEU|nr:class I SAM-dependent methyltransferase [Goodfellowiella coeruleoviolacea]MCP2167710.1 Methyltransferase domain-containing protein [Goodfellowiella coeruleoviolacea]
MGGYSERHAEVYEDILVSRGKDWAAEAALITRLVREHRPDAGSLLDVACGTGVHLQSFRTEFPDVAGVDASPAMLDRAAARLPDVPLTLGDMREFDLGRTFDAVTCLCFAIGYMTTTAELGRAIGRMAAHVRPGGVLVVEPWWFPERFLDGYVDGHLLRDEHRVVSRVTHSSRDNGATRMEVRIVIAEPSGVREFTEYEVVSLFTLDEYLAAFRAAGCTARFRPDEPNGRGLFVATRG